MNYPREDTIVAISTPPGEGGIGIVRISGPEALLIADRIFHSPKGIKPSKSPSHRIYYGFIVNPLTGEMIDEVLLSVMRAPNTYTKEDVVEINCHGGYVVLRRVLELVVNSGARLALPGEFTLRAFLNGRIDLTQAEAVLDLIRSKTEEAEKIALEHVSGSLRREIEDLSEALKDILTELEAFIDFPEEDINLSPVNWAGLLTDIEERLRRLSKSFYQGRILRDGIATVIAGRPNVGKSSLLNALLGMDRAIVTEIPGTTRDIIEEVINIKGIPLRLIDTAGIRDARDLVEAEGIKRTELAIERADMVLLVIDGSEALTSYDLSLVSRLKGQKKMTIVILNKKDKGIVVDKEALREFPFIEISALKREGIDDLKELIFNHIISRQNKGGAGFESLEGVIITRTRHKALVDEALQFVKEAISCMQTGQPLEIVSFNLRSAIESLYAITGIEFSEEDILERIFSEFCIGK
ncbi:MAG: tRNA uridine-5-carboxymethylaminomethyl(34) synthesis GTPase MnmE [Thermodesulfovibrionales bacterium]